MTTVGLGWGGIVRLGLVQASLGAVVVLTTSTINRLMVVELALPAVVPGFLVALHYAVQMSRPRFGYGADVGGRCTPWILGGMLVLATGGVGAALGTALLSGSVAGGLLLCVLSFVLIGLGVGASGTSLLTLLAKRVADQRKPAAATVTWIMMIAGFAVTAGIAGSFLDPYSPARLVAVTAVVAILACAITALALFGLERRPAAAPDPGPQAAAPAGMSSAGFRAALRQIWQEAEARRFTVFIFVSMLAYSAQDLILEPYAGTVFGMTPGESTRLSGIQHTGVLLGMIVVALSATFSGRGGARALRYWTAGGCIASALALLGIAVGGSYAADWPLRSNVALLGAANGAFAVAAIASMMTLANHGSARREGLRMGLWGASQAIAFALGGFLGTVAIDLTRLVVAEAGQAYALVFTAEAMLFLVAAVLANRVRTPHSHFSGASAPGFHEVAAAHVLGGR